MKKILASFLIAITLISNFSINVYASELGGGGYAHKWVGWSDEEKKSFCRDKLTGAILQRVGVVIQPDKWTSEAWTNAWNKHLGEIEIASGMTYDEYIMSLVSVDEDNEEFIISDSLLDSFHSVANIYIEEETGYFVIPTLSAKDLLAENFYNKDTFDMFKNYINNLGTDICICRGYYGDSYAPIIRTIKNGENVNYDNNPRSYGLFRFASNYGLVGNKISYTYNTNFAYLNSCSVYDASWNVCYNKEFEILDFISLSSAIPYMNTSYEYNATEGDLFLTHSNIRNMSTELYFDDATAKHQNSLFTSDGRSIRVYKTFHDAS